MTKVGGIRKIMVLWQAVFLAASLYCQKEKRVLKITTVLLHSKSAVFYQPQDRSKSNKLKMTIKRGTVKLLLFLLK